MSGKKYSADKILLIVYYIGNNRWGEICR